MAEFIRLYEKNIEERKLRQIVTILQQGGLIIYPTDTVYGMGCDITNTKAMERLASIKQTTLEKADFSIICNDLSHISDFTKPISTTVYKILKRGCPGPYTFILNANTKLPKAFKKRKTIGIRVPDNIIPREIVKMLGNPIATTSVLDHDEIVEYSTDPELIRERHDHLVDAVIDGGYGDNIASTVIDLCSEELILLRQGKGDIETLL